VTHIIAEPCIGTKDTACVAVCPVDCIHPTKEERGFEVEPMLYIDPSVCIDCGLCVDVCPVRAIFPEHELPLQWAGYRLHNVEYYDTE
jgi:NAD-dependent dihydropyrimidine dehydrogenase PreA subunit